MKLVLFGNRGSRPLGASHDSPFEKFGGDTTSMGIICEDKSLIAIDAGSAFWKWQYSLENYIGRKPPYDVDLFFSHYHLDHTIGLPQSPFFFTPDNTINFYGPDVNPSMMEVLLDLAAKPGNPDLQNHYNADLYFNPLSPEMNEPITLNNDTKVSWLTLPHGKEESLGYRFDNNGQSICILSDTHHEFDPVTNEPVINDAIIDFIRDADILVYDSHFTDAELANNPLNQSFGHSSGEHGVRLAAAANVPILIKHHHDPTKIDSKLFAETDDLKKYAENFGVTVFPAKPSMCVDLSLEPHLLIKSLEQQIMNRQERYNAMRDNPEISTQTVPQPKPGS